MFSRASTLSPACLKCQKRLAVQIRTRNLPNVLSLLHPPVHRWQSAIALRVHYDDHVAQPADDVVLNSQRQEINPTIQNIESALPDGQNRAQKRAKYRRWRPHQAEELGVNVLGKPAEVLILPTRKRKIAQLAPEEAKIEEKAGLQKSLDSEMRPMSISEALKNIDSMKVELGRGNHEFSAAEWKEYKRRLSAGFTKMQLQEYLRIAFGMSEPELKEAHTPSANQKRSLAAKIMTKAWDWSCRDTEDPASPSGPKQSKKKIVVNAAKLDYIMQHEKHQLGHISETLDVQIDVFKKKSQIQLSGSPAAIQNASTRLSQIMKSVQESSLQLPRSIREFLGDAAKSEPWLATIMQKLKVRITRDGDIVKVVGPVELNADIVLRDLSLLSGAFRSSITSSFCRDPGQEPTTKAPFYPSDLPQWLHQDKSWYRHVSTLSRADSDQASSRSDSREVRRWAGNVLKSDKPDQQKLSQYVISPGSLSHEYVADVGQALFNIVQPGSSGDMTSVAEQSLEDSVFVLQQGLLSQVLAKKDFVSVNDLKAFQNNLASETGPPFLLRLRLHPIAQASTFPSLELFLSGRDASLGHRQQLQIKKVVAVLDVWQHILLLPHLPLDILMTRQSKLDLLNREDAKPTKRYLEILRQLGSHLEHIEASSQLELPPIWNLDLSSLLSNKGITSQARNKSSLSTSGTNDPGLEADNKKAIGDSKTTCTYILEPPETLDVASYTSELAGDRYIDHILCDTESADKPRQRQILRISPNSLSQLMNDKVTEAAPETTNTIEKQRWFKNSIIGAYGLAAMLGKAEKSTSRDRAPVEIEEYIS